jgi:ABC-type uncharacterized transport system permease subunit
MELEGIRAIFDGSKEIVSWSLMVIGGSIATLLGTSYIRPAGKKMRIFYLLFLLGWGALAISFMYGNEIAGNGIMAAVGDKNPEILESTLIKMGMTYKDQLRYFYYGMAIFGIWLCIYLFWWIFYYNVSKN